MTVADLRALLAKAKLEGEYAAEHGSRHPPGCSSSYVQVGTKWPLAHCYGSAGSQEAKAELVAATLNALPALLDVVEAAERTLTEPIPHSHRLRCECAECSMAAALAKLETP